MTGAGAGLGVLGRDGPLLCLRLLLSGKSQSQGPQRQRPVHPQDIMPPAVSPSN